MTTFTIEAPQGSLTTTPIGPLPGGFRVQVEYPSTVMFIGDFGEKPDAPQRFEGNVVTGLDWMFLRDDGVATFDARFTFRADRPGTHYFDATMSGQADLSNLKSVGEATWKPIADATGLAILEGPLAVTLPIAFRTSLDTSLIGDRKLSDDMKAAARYAKAFGDLAKGQFVANGTIVFKAGRVDSLELTVSPIGVRPQPGSGAVAGVSEEAVELLVQAALIDQHPSEPPPSVPPGATHPGGPGSQPATELGH
jgi:hypothetical protein